MNENKKIAYIIGQVVALIAIGCIATCLCGIAVALTLKFLALIF